MKRTLLVIAGFVLVAGVGLLWVPAYAHHSFAADYFESEMVSIEGPLLEFHYKNPHSIMVILVKDDRDRAQTFTAEFGGINRLGRDGITRDTFKAGDYLILSGSPGRRAEDRKLHLKGIHRPADGYTWGRR